MNDDSLCNMRRILVVDDDTGLASVIRSHLPVGEFIVDDAADAKEALNSVARSEEPYEIALIDLWIPPGGSKTKSAQPYLGIQLANQLAEISPRTKLIAISLYGDRKTTLRNSGRFSGFIEKDVLARDPQKVIAGLLTSKTDRELMVKTNAKGICLAIMSSEERYNNYYDSIYKPAILSTGLEPYRIDDLSRPSAITGVWDYAKRARVILADLTGRNPNVFYELGVAQSFAKPAILTAQSMDDVPFDLRSLRCIIYDKDEPDWGQLLKERIEQSIKEILMSPVEGVLPIFISTTVNIGSSTNEGLKVQPKQSPSSSKKKQRSKKKPFYVFIGHGRNPVWAKVQAHIKDDLGIKCKAYESDPRAGKHIVDVLSKLLATCSFAVLVVTAEDETKEGNRRPRQNVLHEIGLFQGRLGFDKVVLLVQDGVERFSNIDGLQYISFIDYKIEQTYYELDRALKRALRYQNAS